MKERLQEWKSRREREKGQSVLLKDTEKKKWELAEISSQMHNDSSGERHRGVKKPVNSTAAQICETATKTQAIKCTYVVKRSSCTQDYIS